MPLSFYFLIFMSAFSLSCKLSKNVSKPKAHPVDRRVLGKGQPYGGTSFEIDKARLSMKHRRDKAWLAVKNLVAQVPIGSLSENFNPNGPKKIPLWQTFYESSEFEQMFRQLYKNLGPIGRRQQKRFCPSDLARILDDHAKKRLSFVYSERKFNERLGQFDSVEATRGVSGRGVTLFSPAIILHLLQNYRELAACSKTIQNLDRDAYGPSPDNFAPCLSQEFPSREFKKPAMDEYSHCQESADSLLTDFQKVFDQGGVSVAVKTSWQEVTSSSQVAVFDTDADSMKKTLEDGEWTPSSYIDSTSLDPSEIYTIELINSLSAPIERARYQLTGLHFVTKDERDWLWISLFWSPDASEDLGADRPSDLQETPWKNYKMCVVSDYPEAIASPGEEFQKEHPDLAATLEAIKDHAKFHTWCSNPYIEQGKGNARTNCIGCHQHGGTNESSGAIFLDDPKDPLNAQRRLRFPHSSRSKVRNNFPADYLWSLRHNPDFFDAKIKKTIDKWKAIDGL